MPIEPIKRDVFGSDTDAQDDRPPESIVTLNLEGINKLKLEGLSNEDTEVLSRVALTNGDTITLHINGLESIRLEGITPNEFKRGSMPANGVLQHEEPPDYYPDDTERLEAFIDVLQRARIDYTEMLGALGNTERLVGARGVTAVLLDLSAASYRLLKEDRNPIQIDRIRGMLLDCIINASTAIVLLDEGNIAGE